MAISGLVITLEENAAAAEQAMRLLRADSRLSLGERAGRRLPLVAETPSAEADASLWADLLATPGVRAIDVTFVSVDSAPSDAAGLHAPGGSYERSH
ncbi:MAG: hypothetical protein IPM64_00275 [Phycisphaerales bacterium]|nr:hypothetical protein [Phycisphaerales bacterium]